MLLLPRVCNVKISFHLDPHFNTHLLKESAHKVTNYYIIVKDIYTYTIYYKSNIANITGIPNFERVDDALSSFLKLTNFSCRGQVRIDNSTVTGRLEEKISFPALFSFISKENINYNPSLFPGAFLKLPNGRKVILFKSGKYNLVGCKNQVEIEQSFLELKHLLQIKK